MNQKKNEAHLSSVPNMSPEAHKMKRRASVSAKHELCECQPLTTGRQEGNDKQKDAGLDSEQVVLVSRALNSRLHAMLQRLFPRVEPLSLLVLHISQLEPTPLAPSSHLLYKRRRYHAPQGLLEQVLANVQRVIRVEDRLLLHDDTGLALIFPGVDQQGAQIILERVYSSVCLLQAETLLPPLTRETKIVLGIGSYPAPAAALDLLYQQVGRNTQSLVLRPIITTRDVKPVPTPDALLQTVKAKREQMHGDLAGIPFMDLPRVLPTRLTQLIPFAVALELQCAPVGRDHYCLTVAMLDPTDTAALHRLQQVTGMTIFPVSCDDAALRSLLAHAW